MVILSIQICQDESSLNILVVGKTVSNQMEHLDHVEHLGRVEQLYHLEHIALGLQNLCIWTLASPPEHQDP